MELICVILVIHPLTLSYALAVLQADGLSFIKNGPCLGLPAAFQIKFASKEASFSVSKSWSQQNL